MGAKMLKRKVELNYRRGTVARCCTHCCNRIGPSVTDVNLRCKAIGDKPGRMYVISPAYVCDAYLPR